MKKPSVSIRKAASVLVTYILLYLLTAFATYDLLMPLKAFEYIVGRAVFSVLTIILFYALPPIDEILEEIIP